ncbi:hypothetical protein E8L90_17360 [Brevibacillus antibioticus]|uniref:Uncharacterized protein n=1 Tax=Brevibacillus antibioticus TaxID=2570228 RepID=A0A4U2YFN6_9BACL|nr:hypothetical protein E8L90_17360 [Brevibacillus antibioticus]
MVDLAEHIYHEFVHNSLFVDDMVNSIFPDPAACAEEDGLVTSTILKIKRPLDRSYHAANVAVSIMHLYYMLRDRRKDRNYFPELAVTLNELNQKTYLLGKQGILILEKLNQFCANPSFEDISRSLRK